MYRIEIADLDTHEIINTRVERTLLGAARFLRVYAGKHIPVKRTSNHEWFAEWGSSYAYIRFA